MLHKIEKALGLSSQKAGPVAAAVSLAIKSRIEAAEKAYAEKTATINSKESAAITEQEQTCDAAEKAALETYRKAVETARHTLSTETFNIKKDSAEYKASVLQRAVQHVIGG